MSKPESVMPINLMIVDDSAAIRKILHRVLLQVEMPIGQIHEAGDGLQALELLKHNKVDLILSDLNMPNMDGLQLLSQLKASEQWKHLPVIMVTTEGGHAKVMEAVELGASGYVRKPFTPFQIREKLAALNLGLD